MLLLLDKPKGLTSHDVVDRIRAITGQRRVGHAGTLDPNATGLLIVGVGRESTKKLGEIAKNTTKTYEAEITLGETRDTDDIEGKILEKSDIVPTIKQVKDALLNFIGDIEQIPPSFSAIKISGKKMYQLARKGAQIEVKPRKVSISNIDLIDYSYPKITLTCEVSSGTYIRAIARDLGKMLHTGAYLSNLRRTKIGSFSLKKAAALTNINSHNWEDFAI